jgi:hypothetical protein
VGSGVIAAGVLAFGPSFWSQALAAESLTAGDGPTGRSAAPTAVV